MTNIKVSVLGPKQASKSKRSPDVIAYYKTIIRKGLKVIVIILRDQLDK